MPKQKIENILSEISLADLDFQILITWGRNDIVVSVPAANPNKVMRST
jgi:hypothetical protein